MTTPPINDFQDILDAMEQNPALTDQMRTHILTQELLQLPAQFLLLRTDVDGIKTDMAQVIDRVGNVEVRMDRVEGRLGNIEGNLYEERAARTVLQLANVELDIERPSIAFSHFGDAHPNFNQVIQRAVQDGTISREELRDLLQTDLVVYGGNRHLVAEISLGPNLDDVSRALRRSQVLSRATGDQVTAVVVAPTPHPEFIQEAEASNVTVLDIPA